MDTGFLGPAVATVLTVYGIETDHLRLKLDSFLVATVLTVYGIETLQYVLLSFYILLGATVPTV